MENKVLENAINILQEWDGNKQTSNCTNKFAAIGQVAATKPFSFFVNDVIDIGWIPVPISRQVQFPNFTVCFYTLFHILNLSIFFPPCIEHIIAAQKSLTKSPQWLWCQH